MNLADNEPSSTSHSFPQEADIPSCARREEHASEHAQTSGLSSSARHELAQSLTSALEAREDKIRELQDAIKSGTYDVTAEQIAEKMLRDTLRHQRP